MLDNNTIDEIADRLLTEGTTTFEDSEGRRVLIMYAAKAGFETREFVLAYEKVGAMFFNLDRPLNKFRLSEAGFPLRLAPVVAETVNRLFVAVQEATKRNSQEGQVPIGELK